MKRDDILMMEPSAHLNKLIQEKVFGTTVFYSMADDNDIWHKTGIGDIDAFSPVPDYSQSISAAWELESIFNQDSEIRGKFIEALADVVCANLGVTPLDDFWSLIYASPSERCKAALLAIMDV